MVVLDRVQHLHIHAVRARIRMRFVSQSILPLLVGLTTGEHQVASSS